MAWFTLWLQSRDKLCRRMAWSTLSTKRTPWGVALFDFPKQLCDMGRLPLCNLWGDVDFILPAGCKCKSKGKELSFSSLHLGETGFCGPSHGDSQLHPLLHERCLHGLRSGVQIQRRCKGGREWQWFWLSGAFAIIGCWTVQNRSEAIWTAAKGCLLLKLWHVDLSCFPPPFKSRFSRGLL